ncbi:hypothetical protein FX016_21800 [Cupriavidus gilardii]|nr:hypothetical protein FX016_21800 [Cupriavidus gilardii]
MRTVKTFVLFGRTYRTKQLPAAVALAETKEEGTSISPVEVLRQAEAAVLVKDQWVTLDNGEAINEHVSDPCGGINAHAVLDALLDQLQELNFGFLSGRKEISIPARFRSPVEAPAAGSLPPVLATLVANGLATLKDLQTVYSAEDAMEVFDAFSADQLAKALAHEAAAKEAEQKAKAKR